MYIEERLNNIYKTYSDHDFKLEDKLILVVVKLNSSFSLNYIEVFYEI